MTQLESTLRALTEQGVKFVVIGAVAAVARGSAHTTRDLDVCYDRSPDNLERLRGGPEMSAWSFDIRALKNGMNFTLATDLGDVDLLGEVTGVGQFPALLEGSTEMELFGIRCRVASLKTLIASKRAAGRTKDLLMLPELEALLEIKPEDE
jgi:predicted nucleotidyltransferase